MTCKFYPDQTWVSQVEDVYCIALYCMVWYCIVLKHLATQPSELQPASQSFGPPTLNGSPTSRNFFPPSTSTMLALASAVPTEVSHTVQSLTFGGNAPGAEISRRLVSSLSLSLSPLFTVPERRCSSGPGGPGNWPQG